MLYCQNRFGYILICILVIFSNVFNWNTAFFHLKIILPQSNFWNNNIECNLNEQKDDDDWVDSILTLSKEALFWTLNSTEYFYQLTVGPIRQQFIANGCRSKQHRTNCPQWMQTITTCSLCSLLLILVPKLQPVFFNFSPFYFSSMSLLLQPLLTNNFVDKKPIKVVGASAISMANKLFLKSSAFQRLSHLYYN